MAGYSEKSLKDKLGLKPNQVTSILNAPPTYLTQMGLSIQGKLTPDSDFIHYFTKEKEDLISEFPNLKQHLKKGGSLWISWPKGSSGIKTDANENLVRQIGLENGLVDVKVAAVDEVWSGLKFVYRLTDR